MKEKEFKLAIIHGAQMVDFKCQDGFITVFEQRDNENHIHCFIEYLKNNYKDHPELQTIDFTTDPNSIGMNMAELGDVVIYNTTSYPKSGRSTLVPKSVTFLMPEQLTDKQKETIELFKYYIKHFNSFVIISDINKHDQYRTAKRYEATDIDLLDFYMYRKDEQVVVK